MSHRLSFTDDLFKMSHIDSCSTIIYDRRQLKYLFSINQYRHEPCQMAIKNLTSCPEGFLNLNRK